MAREWNQDIDRPGVEKSRLLVGAPVIYYYGYDKGKQEEREAASKWWMELCATHYAYTPEDKVPHHRCSACIEEVCIQGKAPWDTD